ncbi:protease inhibitor Inh/omp19 family protein [Ancylobacter polymorphus]|uniref:Protease inhibitor Inh/omp19 family protein n=1 Tax=Ancylobacter polymorphus TaxID=223390 RepID=A0A9E6ZRH1_9HYPH|nr:protease inhibitor Inh/omp19 family protein [Ancylobacter polymorphus]UOK69181.1 protease inhibitor Inh/omp19 family protein [Ancylobacter polymorphus]
MPAPRRPARRRPRVAAALVAGVLALAHGAPASAQESDIPEPATLAAEYRLTNADGDRVCLLTLSEKPQGRARSPARFEVALDRQACAGAILFSVDIASWSPGPGNAIRLQGPDGALVAEFTEGVGGTWEALREGDGVYFLVNPRLADPALHAADLVGMWDMAEQAGKPLCRLELTNAEAGGGTFRARLAKGCPARLVALAPDRWRLDGGSLVLLTARGEGLRFAAQEDGGWEKVPPDEGTPLLLSRP